jgi:uncharacterized coiled-coil protein SlyX
MAKTREDEQPVHAETAPAPVGDPAAIDIDLTIKAKDETIAAREREIAALHGTIAKKNETIASLEESFKAQGETIDHLNAQIAKRDETIATFADNELILKRDLGMARLAAKSKASSAPAGIERLPGGGIRFPVELDVDEAGPLLDWANSAGEDPAVYIARQVKDAMVMVVSS